MAVDISPVVGSIPAPKLAEERAEASQVAEQQRELAQREREVAAATTRRDAAQKAVGFGIFSTDAQDAELVAAGENLQGASARLAQARQAAEASGRALESDVDALLREHSPEYAGLTVKEASANRADTATRSYLGLADTAISKLTEAMSAEDRKRIANLNKADNPLAAASRASAAQAVIRTRQEASAALEQLQTAAKGFEETLKGTGFWPSSNASASVAGIEAVETGRLGQQLLFSGSAFGAGVEGLSSQRSELELAKARSSVVDLKAQVSDLAKNIDGELRDLRVALANYRAALKQELSKPAESAASSTAP